MSTKSRGLAAEDHARQLLEADGYLVEQCKPSVRVKWSREKNDYVREAKEDFFGVVDLIALKATGVRLIQVTHPSGVGERVAKIQNRIPLDLLDTIAMRWEVWEWLGTEFRRRVVGPNIVYEVDA